MKNLILIFASLFLIASCEQKAKAVKELPSDSIFHLTSEWEDQNGETIKLADLKGKTMVVVMIYTSCQSACPILVADMKKIEREIDRKYIDDVSLVLVSIDPENDTPEVLKEFAVKNKMSDPQWIFLRSNEAATQEFANVLSMKYKKISPIDFSHSNIISIFNPIGELISQEEGLEINEKSVAEKVNKSVESNN